jgi:hypothetical protein
MPYIVDGLTKSAAGEGSVRRIAECNRLEDALKTVEQIVCNVLSNPGTRRCWPLSFRVSPSELLKVCIPPPMERLRSP